MVDKSNNYTIWDDFLDGKDRPDDLPQLALVTLTLENKQRLFQTAINASEKSMESTRALMARLEQFDPATAHHFGFKDLTLSKVPFRLLRSPTQTKATDWLKAAKWLKGIIASPENEMDRSNLATTSISPLDRPFESFICLSYCWHNQDWTPKIGSWSPETGSWTPATGRGLHEEWPIAKMMLRAFLDQRKSYDEGVWIDALCIDQNNPTEQMHAIGSMDVIYKSARMVVITLEDVCLPDAVSNVLIMLSTVETDQEKLRECSPVVWQGLGQILSSRWFKRAWCWHELQLAAYSLFLVPTESGAMRITVKHIVDLHGLAGRADHSSSTSFPVEYLLIIERLLHTSPYKYVGRIKYKRSPMAQFNSIIHLNSSFETDKIGIAANVAGLQIYYKGPEMSNSQCRWILAMLALFAGDLASLCGNGPAIQMTEGIRHSSWLRWWNSLENIIFSLSGPIFPKRPGIVSINHERIILDLLVLEQYTLNSPSTEYLRIAKIFLERHAKDIALDRWVEEVPRKPWSQSENRDKIELLACSLECGLPWLTESMTLSHDIAHGMWWKVPEDDVWPLVSDLLIQAYPDQESTILRLTKEQKRSVLQQIHFILFYADSSPVGSGYGSGLVQSDNHPGVNQCRRLDWGIASGKALTFFASDKIRDCCLAVPVALSDPPWTTMNRLWLLKPLVSTTGSHWTIVEKIRLVTPRPLEEEGGLVLRAAQSIRG
jgi:hypothetical protein